MTEYNIITLKVKKGSANLIIKKVKGYYINISRNEGILIDNERIARWDDVHSVEWLKNGYKNIVECNVEGKLEVEE